MDRVGPLGVSGLDELPPCGSGRLEVARVATPVVPPCHDLEGRQPYCLVGIGHPRQQERCERLGAGDERGHVVVPVGPVPDGDDRVEAAIHVPVHVRAELLQRRLVEPMEPDVAGDVRDHRMPVGHRGNQPVQAGAHLGLLIARQAGAAEDALEDRYHDGELSADALVGPEYSEERVLEGWTRVERLDPVVRHCPGQIDHEGGRQAFGHRIQGPQIGVEVLFGTAHEGVGSHPVMTTPEEDAQVGEDPEGVELRIEGARIRRLWVAVDVVGSGAGVVGVDVVAEDQLAHDPGAPRPSGGSGIPLHRGSAHLERRERDGCRHRIRGVVLHQRRPRRHLDVGTHHHPADPSGAVGGDHDLHLHALDDRDRVSGGDVVAGSDAHGNDDPGRRSTHDADVVPAQPVRLAIDLHVVVGARHRRDDPVPLRPDDDQTFERARPLDLHIGDG